MGCGSTVVKIILFVANVLFAMAAIALVAVGLMGLVAMKERGLYDHDVKVASIIFIVVGVVAFVIAFLGCCGAIMENRGMLITYSVLLIILIILKTALAVLIFVTAGSVKEAAGEILRSLFNERTSNDTFSQIEQLLECCGLEGSKSYYYVPPISCCPQGSHTCSERNVFREGCLRQAGELVDNYTVVAGSLCFAIVAVELLAATFGLCLAGHVNDRYKGRY